MVLPLFIGCALLGITYYWYSSGQSDKQEQKNNEQERKNNENQDPNNTQQQGKNNESQKKDPDANKTQQSQTTLTPFEAAQINYMNEQIKYMNERIKILHYQRDFLKALCNESERWRNGTLIVGAITGAAGVVTGTISLLYGSNSDWRQVEYERIRLINEIYGKDAIELNCIPPAKRFPILYRIKPKHRNIIDSKYNCKLSNFVLYTYDHNQFIDGIIDHEYWFPSDEKDGKTQNSDGDIDTNYNYDNTYIFPDFELYMAIDWLH